MKELEQDPEHYKNYMRMDLSTFEELATKLEPLLKKCDTQMRNAFSPREQLAVTLRFLATGEAYTNLQYQFRINKEPSTKLFLEYMKQFMKHCRTSTLNGPQTVSKNGKILPWNFGVAASKLFGSNRWKTCTHFTPSCIWFNNKGFFSIVLLAIVRAK